MRPVLSPSDLFQSAWKQSLITKPVIVLIGGYAGTGKSTLAHDLAKRLQYAQSLPSGIFRSIAQTQTTPQLNPALYSPTYDLGQANADGESIINDFKQQCQPVNSIILSVIQFMAVEKQHLIIEGNHIVPWENYEVPGCTIIELYLYVDDVAKHRQMLGGPTHNRQLTDAQFQTGRVIDSYIRAQAVARSKCLFESEQATEQAINYFETALEKAIKTNSQEQNV